MFYVAAQEVHLPLLVKEKKMTITCNCDDGAHYLEKYITLIKLRMIQLFGIDFEVYFKNKLKNSLLIAYF